MDAPASEPRLETQCAEAARVEGSRVERLRVAIPLLIILYALVQSWVLGRAVCPARDGERYLQFALRLEAEPWRDVFATTFDHPGYPLAIRGVFAVADLFGPSSSADRVFQAQLTSSICGLLYLLAAFALLRITFGARIALIGSLALVFLPRPHWLFADVLSDPAFSAPWVASAAAIAYFFRSRSFAGTRGFRTLCIAVTAGLFGALAYSVRVDALTLVALVAGVLTARFLLREPRRAALGMTSGSALRVCGASLAFTAAFALGPLLFLVVYGRVSPKPVANVLLNAFRLDAPEVSLLPLAGILPPSQRDWAESVLEYFKVLGQQLQFFHLGAAIITLVLLCVLRRWSFGTLLAFAATMLYLVVFVTLRLRVGYAVGRYLLVVLPFVIGFALTGVEILGDLLRGAFPRRDGAKSIARSLPWLALVASLAFSIPSLASRSLHEGQTNVVAAGAWCAERMRAGDTVHDPFFFPSFLRGLKTRPELEPASTVGIAYAIARHRDDEPPEPIASLVAQGRARLQARFEEAEEEASAGVYRILPGRPEGASKP